MVMLMNLQPGDTILEAGSGSGGLTMFCSRAVGPTGKVLSIDIREDFSTIAKRNFKEANPNINHVTWTVGNVGDADTIEAAFLAQEKNADRDPIPRLVSAVALDIMEPWLVLNAIGGILQDDGVLVAYVPNITQAVELLSRIEEERLPFIHETTIEA